MHPGLKALVERHPALAASYRDAGAWWRARTAQPRVTPHGFRMRGDEAVASAGFESDEVEWISAHLADFDLFVDVGAHHGFYTCLTGTRGKRVIAFEPSQKNLRYLLGNIELNRLEHVEVFPVGLAAAPGVLKLFGRNTGASLLAGWNGQSVDDHEFVAISTLDRLLDSVPPETRMAVKIDVEGAELGLLRGAARTLRRRVPPLFLVEICLTENQKSVNPDFRETFEAFWDAGYEARTVDAEARLIAPADVDRWIARGKRDFGSYNVAFSRPGAAPAEGSGR